MDFKEINGKIFYGEKNLFLLRLKYTRNPDAGKTT